MATLLVRKMNSAFLHDNYTLEEIDYFTKCMVVALNSNESLFIRQNITCLISNLLLPITTEDLNHQNMIDEFIGEKK